MVLDNAAVPMAQSDFASDFDPDNNPPQDRVSLNFDLDTLPSSMPILGPFFGYNRQRTGRAIQANLQNLVAHLRRLPTRDEANAIAYHTAKGQAISSWGSPLGIVAGIYQAWTTRASYKFPFMKPIEGFNPYAIRFWGMTLLRGDSARWLWHLARCSTYGSIGVLIVSGGLAGYAASVMAVGQLKDPRLKDYVQAIRLEKSAELQRQGAQLGRADPSGQHLWKRHKDAIGASGVDSSSPTVGQGMDFAESQAMEAKMYGNDVDVSDERQDSPSMAPQSPRPRRGPAWNRATTPKSDTEISPSSSFYGDFDDASPTAPDGTTGDAKVSSNGSAWERLRRNAGRNTSSSTNPSTGRGRPPPQPVQDEDTAGTDSYSFPNSDEERQQAKDQAQRDFDAQVEQERHGGDFSSNERRRGW